MIARPAAAALVGALLACAATAAGGEFERRFELTLERVLDGGPPAYDPPLLLADVEPHPGRRFTEFSGDLSGRYLGALAAAAAMRPGALERARGLAPRIFALQRDDGRFGDPLSGSGAADDDMARLWGQGRLLIGLVEYHRAAGDPAALAAARRLGDFLVASGPRFNAEEVRRAFSDGKLAHGYICWTQNIEGLAALYAATRGERYAMLAGQLAERIERRPGQHSHGLLTSLRGLLALAEATGEQRYADQAAREWVSLASSENLLPTASIPEYFPPEGGAQFEGGAPGIYRDEGCSQADWVRLSLELWRRSGEERYLEVGERALFNAFYMNQMSTGDFGHVAFGAGGLDFGETRAWWCCTLHGLRAFPAIAAHVFRADPGGLRYELPLDGRGESEGFRVEAASSLERDGRVTLEVLAAPRESATLRIRRPRWVRELLVDGEPVESEAALARSWRAGDRVEVEYRLESRSEPGPRGSTLHWLGPWLMGVGEAAAPAYFDEPHEHNRLAGRLRPAADGAPVLEASYRPAGYPDQIQPVRLLPLAQRGMDGAGLRWVFAWEGEGGGRRLAGLARRARPWIAPFAAGLLLGSLGVWLVLRRRRAA